LEKKTNRFTVLVSCSGELAAHSCLLLYLQGQVRVARLAFLRPNFRNLASYQVGWPKKIAFGLLPDWPFLGQISEI